MVEPHLIADGDFTTFVSGNDDAAKAQVMSLLGSLGAPYFTRKVAR
ncbi:hypothetical protein [Nocardioides sp. B-3]|nr:hypothetical protein [Nocardioides sp. B-3]UUZ61162.1 hypothetical protein LP418_11375 [Nocardioides sp. B-3]